jgi:hypothetical protein
MGEQAEKRDTASNSEARTREEVVEQASEVLLQMQDDAEPVMGATRSCARCNERCHDTRRPLSQTARFNGVDWTADELHLNGVFAVQSTYYTASSFACRACYLVVRSVV